MAVSRNQKLYPALRALAARRDGYACAYCQVPTAATLEHRDPRVAGGDSWLENLCLACPYCNTRKGKMAAEEFVQSERWRLAVPPELPQTTREMLRECFSWEQRSGRVRTGTVNSVVELKGGQVYVLVRAHPQEEWQRVLIGPEDHSQVSRIAWAFLKRHYTPPVPRVRKPPKSVYRKSSRARARASAPAQRP